jgi:16S rRNA (guanine527-N7)-methyltransferase
MDLVKKYHQEFEFLYEQYSIFNSHTNISAIRDREEVYCKHFRDSLQVLNLISDDLLEASSYRILDIGTGGGFPALPLAIVLAKEFPKLSITAIDGTAKKIKFVNLIKKELNLANLEALAIRAEELAHREGYRDSYNLVLSRAVAYLPTLLEYAVPFLLPPSGLPDSKKSRLICYKKQGIEHEIAEAKNSIDVLGVSLVSQYAYDDKQLLVFEKNLK